ncbi:MAG: hypothetical protein HY056_18400 [Proteobacteria bacterium]|nr:hypothetical protein [Pseudomonadota bacterium]
MAANNTRDLTANSSIALLLRMITRSLRDPYRPELHYMRGPGPKWREKHAPAASAAENAIAHLTQATA